MSRQLQQSIGLAPFKRINRKCHSGTQTQLTFALINYASFTDYLNKPPPPNLPSVMSHTKSVHQRKASPLEEKKTKKSTSSATQGRKKRPQPETPKARQLQWKKRAHPCSGKT